MKGRRISPKWRWLVYLVTFTAAFTIFGWVAYGALSWLVVAVIAVLGAPAMGVLVWREEQQDVTEKTE